MILKNKTRFVFRLCAVLLAFSCVLSSTFFVSPFVGAQSDDKELENLQKQYEELEKEIQKNQAELKEVQGNIKDNKKRLSALNGEIDSINSQIGILDSKIKVLDGKINTIEANIEKQTNDINTIKEKIDETNTLIAETKVLMQETREILMGRLRENYMSGESTTLEILFSVTDLSSYFTRVELMNRVSENDAKLISDLGGDIKKLEELEAQLEKDKIGLEEKKGELEAEIVNLDEKKQDEKDSIAKQQEKKKTVTTKQIEVKDIIKDLDEDSAEYKAIIKRKEAEMEILSKQIDEYIRQHGSSLGDIPNASFNNDGKMAWPVKFESYMSAGYPAYSNGSAHWGIDICAVGGNTRGRPFNAAQGGEVIIAVNDGTWNYGFGNYCVIDHGDGTQTLYAHSDGLKVSKGQVVRKGQEIGIIGNTGNSTGPHLHFEVRVKNADGTVSRVNPLNYVKNPYA